MNVSSQPTSDTRPLLDVAGLHAGYGRVEILHGVSLSVREREVVSIIGPNGAGKSTVLKVVAGLLPPNRGKVLFGGENITGLAADMVVRRGISFVPQGRIVFPKMSVRENLEMGAFLLKGRDRVRSASDQVFKLFPVLSDRGSQIAETLSGGEQQMLAIARALMISPRLLLLDEPSLGLAPKYVDMVFQKIGELRDAGTTMVIVEQNATRALEAADRAYVLELGRNRFEGTGQELVADPRVRQLYLGG